MLAAGAVISGVTGVAVVGAALGVRYLLREREKPCEAVTVGTAAGGLIPAGAVFSRRAVAIGGRVRRPLGRRAVARADVGRGGGGIGDGAATAAARRIADNTCSP